MRRWGPGRGSSRGSGLGRGPPEALGPWGGGAGRWGLPWDGLRMPGLGFFAIFRYFLLFLGVCVEPGVGLGEPAGRPPAGAIPWKQIPDYFRFFHPF